ncbi:MAG: DIP1984 family protein [Christensenellales bacterium]|jgi:hypothetical protein|nr:DIP1984 family protein [Clostridiales bacterium]
MKLAEALILRKDLQTRLMALEERLMNAAQVQEGDQPAEEPQALLLELDRMTQELQSLITRINLTNSNSMLDGKTVTGLLAQRDMLGRKAGILRDLANTAGQLVRRVRGSEIKIISTVNVADIRKQADEAAKALRELDTRLQGFNWTTDLME